MSKKPLEGIKVVDMSKFAAGPMAGRVMADWGATVYRVEDLQGDQTRRNGAGYRLPHCGETENLFYDHWNANKIYMTLNVKTDEGMKILLDLLAEADVFITSVKERSLKKLGIDFDSLHEKYPQLIFAQVTGYGDVGPMKDKAGYDGTAFWAKSGLINAMRLPGEEILHYFPSIGDTATGDTLTCGILAALVGRGVTGEGTKVTTSLYGTSIFLAAQMIQQDRYVDQWPISKAQYPLPMMATYRCKDDRWVLLLAGSQDAQFNTIMEVLGRNDLIDDDRFSTMAKMNSQNTSAELIEVLDEAFATKNAAEWEELFTAVGVTCEMCNTYEEVYDGEQARANGYVRPVSYESTDDEILTAFPHPVRFSNCDVLDRNDLCKGLGLDNEKVLGEMGYTEEQIAEFREKSVIV